MKGFNQFLVYIAIVAGLGVLVASANGASFVKAIGGSLVGLVQSATGKNVTTLGKS